MVWGWPVVLVPAIPVWGPVGWVAVFGGFPAFPSGVLGCCVLFFVARVWCQLCWMDVLVVGVRGLVVTYGVFSGDLVGGAWPGRWALPAWCWVPVTVGVGGAWPASGGGPLPGGVLPGGVRWVSPPWGCVTGFCGFGVWRWWFGVCRWRGGRSFGGLASCGLCARAGASSLLARLVLRW